ncbi:ABC transporter permease [Acidicapsa dinghuensis]|uniref:ABC transporter permease n=1 Tax=Acidicapsa dinghuensis TaxID=2218256 RepID=A0ABW1EF64_9BACT|nr:ABC transporter permease [Acidicapsa dinghuensis]
MGTVQQDLAYIIRRLSRSKGFAAAVIVSIGLGIAANATIFSMVSRFVLRPTPAGDPSTLLALHTLHDGDQCCNAFPEPIYEDVRDQARSFRGIAAYYELVPASISGSGEPLRSWGQAATANFFDVLQSYMTLGRGFLPKEEDQQVVVLSRRLWQTRFAADPSIVGRKITVSGRPYTVIGVAPKGFHGLDLVLDTDFWVPLGNVHSLVAESLDEHSREQHWLQVVARLNPGVTREQASVELNTIARRLAVAYPATDKGNGFRLDQAGALPPRMKTVVLLFLTALSVVVMLVLCIACANVANLLLAQTVGRQKEMAVRLALGGTRGRILRQMVLESVVLSLSGGVLGVLLSLWSTQSLSAFRIPAPVPLDMSITVDWRVLLFAFVLSVGAGFLFSVIPAWAASRPALMNALKGEDPLAKPGRRITLRSALIVVQMAMCAVLLTATGLFLRSLQNAANIDIGFRTHGMVSMQLDPRVNGYSPERTVAFLHELRDRIAGEPGVQSAVITDTLPLSGGGRSDGFTAVVKTKNDTGANRQPVNTELYMATPGYLETMGIPRITGRDFRNESVTTGPKAAIVNEEFAKQVFGSENPIGQLVSGGGVIYQIIGVAGNIKSRTLGESARAVLFRSLDQTVSYDPATMGYTLVIRYAGDEGTTLAQARQTVRTLDSSIAVYNIATIEEHMNEAFFLPRLAAALFGVFGAIGLILASVGLYGMMSYSVGRRTREIGIRMALGAQALKVQSLILRQGLMLAIIALGLGIPGAIAISRLFSSVLYGIGNHDPITFIVVPVFLLIVALLACWVPARKASRVNPQVVLRSE